MIATGGCPVRPKDIPGAEYGITSDGFFDIEKLPKKIAFVGAGYIAVELAGVMNAIGVETHMVIRGETFLRNFDPMIQRTLTKRYEDASVKIYKNHNGVKEVIMLREGKGEEKLLKVAGNDGEDTEVLWAIGRAPEVHNLGFFKVGIKQSHKGHVEADAFQNTYVTRQAELTPGKCALDHSGHSF